MENQRDLEREEREKYRSPDIARILFSILVLFLSREIAVVNFLMSVHLFISLFWIVLSEKNPLFQSRYPLFWLVPASLDVLNCLMIIYVTGSAYSSWILSLTFITAISASDPLLWRGAFTGTFGAVGLALMLVLVQTGVLPFCDIWKINYRPHSWSLVVQAAALNAGVSFFVWSAVHGSSVIANAGRASAEKENSWIHQFFSKFYSSEMTEKIQRGSVIEFTSPVMTVSVELGSVSSGIKKLNDEADSAEVNNIINSAIIEYDMKMVSQESGCHTFCRFSAAPGNTDLTESVQAALKIHSRVSKMNRSRKAEKLPPARIRTGISLENLTAVRDKESGEIFLPDQGSIISSLRYALFGKKTGIYVSEAVRKSLGTPFESRLEGKFLLKERTENIYSVQVSKSRIRKKLS